MERTYLDKTDHQLSLLLQSPVETPTPEAEDAWLTGSRLINDDDLSDAVCRQLKLPPSFMLWGFIRDPLLHHIKGRIDAEMHQVVAERIVAESLSNVDEYELLELFNALELRGLKFKNPVRTLDDLWPAMQDAIERQLRNSLVSMLGRWEQRSYWSKRRRAKPRTEIDLREAEDRRRLRMGGGVYRPPAEPDLKRG